MPATRPPRPGRIGYPVMLKSTAGGGGIGMRLIWSEDELAEAYASVDRLARANFKDAGIYLEKYVQEARHIEVQIFGDGFGNVVALGERDCSVQRRNQKVIEETPAPNISEAQRARLLDTAVRLGRAVGYHSAGTVEFVYDAGNGEFYFLEVNTRLQVEHGVTEEVTGIDLVEWMLRAAAGELDLAGFEPKPKGAAIQVRLYAEDPNKNFQPAPGLLTAVTFPQDVRVDSWVENGSEIPPYYDPMVAKVIAKGLTREDARDKLQQALAATELHGIETNLDYLRQVVADTVFAEGRQTTRYLNAFHYRAATIDVLEPGVQSSVQDWPGRTGYWDVGVPPSGPMDHLALRLANRLVGNAEGTAALELTAAGPTLKFNCDAVIALAGAQMAATLDGAPLGYWQAQPVKAGSVLRLGAIDGAGLRTYLAVQGGFDVPDYLGSKSTFTLGQFGGHGGRTLRTGDVLRIAAAHPENLASAARRLPLSAALRPPLTHEWEIGVLYGPHGAPDFFTDHDIEVFFATAWEVHYNSSRTGVRLIGPKPQWARTDGGEAGLHPSNIHDNAYAIGAVDFTGDMPVILGPDGPSLGGFVCPATIVQAELWKLGQLKPGDSVRFRRITREQANAYEVAQDAAIAALDAPAYAMLPTAQAPLASPVVKFLPEENEKSALAIRQSGDRSLLVELGPLVLDLELRLHVQALLQALQAEIAAGRLPGVLDLTPGIRSLQVHFDARLIDQDRLIHAIVAADAALPAIDDIEVPSRIVHLPLSWDDPATKLAIEKYMQSVRPDAPWCPSNIEFIRRINGLDSIDGRLQGGVRGELPRHGPRRRLPRRAGGHARRSAPSPGHHQVQPGADLDAGERRRHRRRLPLRLWHGRPGRLPVRRPHGADVEPPPQHRRLYETLAAALLRPDPLRAGEPGRAAAPARGRAGRPPQAGHRGDDVLACATTAPSSPSIARRSPPSRRSSRHRSRPSASAGRPPGQDVVASDAIVAEAGPDSELDLPPNARPLATHVAGNVWKVMATVGQKVGAGDTLLIVESMKMEIPVAAPCAGTVTHLFCKEGGQVAAGQDLLVIEAEE